VFSVLSDQTIQRYVAWGKIGVDPFDPARVQPAHNVVRVEAIDTRDVTRTPVESWILQPGQSQTLAPGGFLLATTNEYIRVPVDLVARVEGKSSLGRLGLTCHATAGFIDPGFEGRITLELYNMNCRPIVIYPDMAICQLSYMTLTEPAARPYGSPGLGSHYQRQESTTESRYEIPPKGN
jgi:dCTP deaminase